MSIDSDMFDDNINEVEEAYFADLFAKAEKNDAAAVKAELKRQKEWLDNVPTETQIYGKEIG